MAYDSSLFNSGLDTFLNGIFGRSGDPYKNAQEQYDKYTGLATGVQEPYYNAGKNALNEYQQWLNNQKNPSQFINDLTKNYKESDYAHNLQQDAIRAAQNAGSATGLNGSSPLIQQIQQNAGKISSEDMNQWLQNVLGINTQYGQGQNNLVQGGQNAANALTNTYNQAGQNAAQTAYGQNAGKNQDFWHMISGGIGALTGLGFL